MRPRARHQTVTRTADRASSQEGIEPTHGPRACARVHSRTHRARASASAAAVLVRRNLTSPHSAPAAFALHHCVVKLSFKNCDTHVVASRRVQVATFGHLHRSGFYCKSCDAWFVRRG